MLEHKVIIHKLKAAPLGMLGLYINMVWLQKVRGGRSDKAKKLFLHVHFFPFLYSNKWKEMRETYESLQMKKKRQWHLIAAS